MLIGRGAPRLALGEREVREICAEALDAERLNGKRVLVVVPDDTRSGPVALFARVLADLIAPQARSLDLLIALGTHPPMSAAAIARHLGDTASRAGVRVHNHAYADPAELVTIGELGEDEIAQISGGRLRQRVPIRLNRRVLDCDLLLLLGPTFPHEVVGYSGGNKYLIPGVAGPELIDWLHWLGALVTSPGIIGHARTPVRALVERAAALLDVPRLGFSYVIQEGELAGLYAGTPEQAWARAAELSSKVHVTRCARPYRQVLSCAPAMYTELWVGAKCAYKLEPVVMDGGELIIYAPHIRELSVVHGPHIVRVGYHVRDYVVAHLPELAGVPLGVLAHSTHVKGLGTYTEAGERPRIEVVLATGIPEEVCRRVNLGYRDPRSIDPGAWQARGDEGLLVVPRAGEQLHRLVDDPFGGSNEAVYTSL